MSEHTIHEAKTHLSKLVARAEAGEDVVLRRGAKAVVRMTALEPGPKKRSLAGWLPPISLDQGFDDPLPEAELRLWNGEGA